MVKIFNEPLRIFIFYFTAETFKAFTRASAALHIKLSIYTRRLGFGRFFAEGFAERYTAKHLGATSLLQVVCGWIKISPFSIL